MMRFAHTAVVCLSALALAGCATRAADVQPAPANPADFALWTCDRIHDEMDGVQQRAAEVAYAVDERAGHNILALGLGLTVFWPAILAMRPDGLEAKDLARLKGRYEALVVAADQQRCPSPGKTLPAARLAQWPVAEGERLVYEVRRHARGAVTLSVLRIEALRRTESEYRSVEPASAASAPDVASTPTTAVGGRWLQDRAGNVIEAPEGSLSWPRLLRSTLTLGQVTAGEMLLVGDPQLRARLRGQVVALGPQTVAGRRFDVAVVELFGDATSGDAFTRVDGALVIDRASGVLLRLDLRSANPAFQLRRRLVRVEAAR